MKLLREQDEAELKQLVAELDSDKSDSDDDEDFKALIAEPASGELPTQKAQVDGIGATVSRTKRRKRNVEFYEGVVYDADDEENFAWYNINDKETFFVLTTLNKHCFKKDSQVFHCYGRRTNANLLGHYGFTLSCNKYDTLKFKSVIDFGWRKNFTEEGVPIDSKDKKKDDMKVTKHIKLKETRLRDEMFAYIRATLMN